MSDEHTTPPPENKAAPSLAGASTLTGLDKGLIVVVILTTTALLGLAFAGSFTTMADVAEMKGVHLPYVVPLVIDGGLVGFLALDMVLTRLGHPLWMLRQAVRLFAGLTVVANGAAGWPDALAILLHVPAALTIIVITESVRSYLMRKTVEPDESEPIPFMRWVLAPIPTFILWRRMVLWRQKSYRMAVEHDITRRDLIDQCRSLGRGWKRQVPANIRRQLRQGVRLDSIGIRIAEITAAAGADSTHPARLDSISSARLTPADSTRIELTDSTRSARLDTGSIESAPESSRAGAPIESSPEPAADSTHPDSIEPGTESSRVESEPSALVAPAQAESIEPDSESSRAESAPVAESADSIPADSIESDDDPDPEPSPDGPRGGGAPAPRIESAPARSRVGSGSIESAPQPEPERSELAPVLAMAAARLHQPDAPETNRLKLYRSLFDHAGRSRDVLAALRAEAGDAKLKAPSYLYAVRDAWHRDVAETLMDEYQGDADRVVAELEAAGVEIRPEVTAEIQRWRSAHGVRALRPVGE